jgi:hypothetical protein
MHPRDQRFECEFPVEIRLPDGEVWAVIRDVGIGGAQIEGASGMRTGQGCTLILEGRRMPATVAWSRGGRCGVKFQRRLLPEEFDLITGVDAYAQVGGRRQSRRFFGSRAA